MANVFNSSTGRKVTMALSALFLIIFLLQHLIINLTSTIDETIFNEISHFMGNNFLIQFIIQPILIIGVIYHFVMGLILEIKNYYSRNVKYAKNNAKKNSSWASRNMIWTGLVIFAFLILHFGDYWFPEINYKYIERNPEDANRYFAETIHKFVNPTRVIVYVISFVFLIFHLWHGFASSFQSLGVSKFKNIIVTLGKWYAICVPLGFIFIALFHYFTQLH